MSNNLRGLYVAVPMEQKADGAVRVHCRDGEVDFPAMKPRQAQYSAVRFDGRIDELPPAGKIVVAGLPPRFHILNQYVIGQPADELDDEIRRTWGRLSRP